MIFCCISDELSFSPLLLSEPQNLFCGTLRFRGAQLEIQWLRPRVIGRAQYMSIPFKRVIFHFFLEFVCYHIVL